MFVLLLLSQHDYGSLVHNPGWLWTTETNAGEWGDSVASMSWPGWYQSINNYYLWQGKLWIGAVSAGETLVIGDGAGWWPGIIYYDNTNPRSDQDIVATYSDSIANPNRPPGKHLGISVLQRGLAWAHETFRSQLAYEFYIWYDKTQNDAGSPDTLRDVFVGIVFDCDVSGADPTDAHIDDLVHFDGWTGHEWDTLQYSPVGDQITLLPFGYDPWPDGVPDNYLVWGDNPWETTVEGDTFLIPRGISYIWDDDDPASPENDRGEFGYSAGYLGVGLIYADPSPADSTGSGIRVCRPWAHQWWDWENDPPTEEARYAYLSGNGFQCPGYRFAPHPFDLGMGVFDYRYLISSGPFNIAHGDTVKLAFGAVIGQGLNGGDDTVYSGATLNGMRQHFDLLLALYYCGSLSSDPRHPSAPDEDVHWSFDCFTDVAESPFETQTPLLRLLNPVAKGDLRLSLSANGLVKLSIYDVSGRRTLSCEVNCSGQSEVVLPASQMPAGAYVIRAVDGERSAQRTFVKW
ncbi:MAG: T9SS type A sorting domain-containing protein [candidate division WOR-3 bacterium]